jgi:hypothetical protein
MTTPCYVTLFKDIICSVLIRTFIIIVYRPHASLSKASWTLFVGISPRRTGLIRGPFRVGFVEGQVKLEQDFLLVIRFSLAIIILAMLHTHPYR